jgi:hypothetical protein
MAARGGKGASYNDEPVDSTRGKLPTRPAKGELPTFIVHKNKPSKDSTAIGRTEDGDTVWQNTGSGSRGGRFYHPRSKKTGQVEDRRYVKH